jgi:hypothetical protein
LWDKGKKKESGRKIENEGLYGQKEEEEALPLAAKEPAMPAFEPGTLFHSPEINWSYAVKNFKVILSYTASQVFKYHVLTKAEKDKYTGEYKQIKPTSPLAEDIIGKNEGDTFEFGGMEYKIVKIEF